MQVNVRARVERGEHHTIGWPQIDTDDVFGFKAQGVNPC
jgi:hypothetical protein